MRGGALTREPRLNQRACARCRTLAPGECADARNLPNLSLVSPPGAGPTGVPTGGAAAAGLAFAAPAGGLLSGVSGPVSLSVLVNFPLVSLTARVGL